MAPASSPGLPTSASSHGHHVVAENYMVEILKDGRPVQPGEGGEVAITDLTTTACLDPLPDRRPGDGDGPEGPAAVDEGCPGSGRSRDACSRSSWARTASHLPGTFFSHFFKDFDHIVRQYQVVQEEDSYESC